MGSKKEPTSVPDFVFPDNGGRPLIKTPSSPPKFRPHDEVLFYDAELKDWTGPFLVTQGADGQYKLCNEQQKEVNGGQWVKEASLKLFDPFE